MNMNPLLKSLFFFILYDTDLIFINQIPFFLSFIKQIWFLVAKSHFFLSFTKQIWFLLTKSHFFIPYKTDLIFVHQISFFFSTLQNRFDFSLRRGHIHRMNFLKLILSSKMFVTCITTYYSMSYKNVYNGH